MPVDFEMLLSSTQSSSLFAYSPFVNSCTLDKDCEDHYRNGHFFLTSLQHHQTFYDETPRTHPFTFRKKKVSFADDKGFNLVQVKEIPRCTDNFLEVAGTDHLLEIGGTAKKINNPPSKKMWKPVSQPPDDVDKMVDVNNVLLETISVNNNTMFGTVKVTNIAFQKQIFVRVTFDRWMTYTDICASYVYPKNEKLNSNKYDCFSFTTDIPASALRFEVIELSVCFKCNGKTIWDNNGGINYRIVSESVDDDAVEIDYSNSLKSMDNHLALSFSESMERFPELDSWSYFRYNQPYW